ncbi:3-oxoacyl-ACP reductase FabG [Baekduia soli]|uniref:3-oxoacyl-ACP reductase FabG n=1 Tax=Baekduia soli TaxID=496014 RepID=A0A5B8U4S1_9ACTN|nr:3-oxoacyl-ACP reductase family protein [Baekduia soli]QEC48020.1 3-oxoacyl-ACP reductase FabG [Baekduia soli]
MTTTGPSSAQDFVAGNKLEGRVAFVTGGTRGIGAAISRSLASQGATVAAGYSRNVDKAEGFRADLEQLGAEASIHQGNVASADDCRRTVGEVIERHGRLDILVNNAGITADARMLKMTAEEWYTVLAVNLSGAFFCAQAALGHMLERGSGRIINISSLAGQSGNIGQTNYAASKSGMFGLTKTMALEAASALAREDRLDPFGIGVTVNCVAPGYTTTDMVADVPPKVLAKVADSIPLKRLGRPEEIARVVHFLCADASGYITGQVWGVNGGLEM